MRMRPTKLQHGARRPCWKTCEAPRLFCGTRSLDLSRVSRIHDTVRLRLHPDMTGIPAIFTEVYSPLWNNATERFDIGDLGAISPTGTEGDAVQLWSYGFLAALDARTGQAVAGGF